MPLGGFADSTSIAFPLAAPFVFIVTVGVALPLLCEPSCFISPSSLLPGRSSGGMVNFEMRRA